MFPGQRGHQIRYLDVALDAPVGSFVPLTPATTRRQVMTFVSTLPSEFVSVTSEARLAASVFLDAIFRQAPEAFVRTEVSLV